MPRHRVDDCSSRILPQLTTNACFSTSRFVRDRDFLTGRVCGFLAAQNFFTGQMPHLGWRGTQTSAPRSISAELKIEALDSGTSIAAYCQSVCRPTSESMGLRKSNNRVKTRAVLASTIGTDLLKAKLATACAVYFPIPGSCCICSTNRGKRPRYRSTTALAVA